MGFSEFDASKYLTDEESIAEYLAAALEDDDADVFWRLWATSPRPEA